MHLGGVTANPTGEWTARQARNLALTPGERFGNFRFLIRGRGSNFTKSFDAVFQANGTRILRTAVQAPRMNATCERVPLEYWVTRSELGLRGVVILVDYSRGDAFSAGRSQVGHVPDRLRLHSWGPLLPGLVRPVACASRKLCCCC
jgi:hypothetical protein